MGTIGTIILLLVIIAVIVVVLAWFYERGTNEVSLIRTGVGGRQVVIDGGVLAVPYFHEITRVNMATLRLDVERRGEQSLITQDKLRVDVGAEFYVSVVPDEGSIARAAQTLGRRTFQREELRSLVDGMMVDALRSVAAQMTMDDLHVNRASFVSQVRDLLRPTLERYGLQLDSVSLTSLDQTPFAALDENNAFNAVGMRKLAEVISKSKKDRAEIDAESEVSVRRSAMEASRKRLEIELEERRAEIAQQQEIETLAAAQIAEVAQRKADSELSATRARIEMERSIQAAEVERSQALEIAEQDRQIAIAAKSQEESKAQSEAEAAQVRAQAEADRARAEAQIETDEARTRAIQAAQAVETARAMAEAERRTELTKITAESEARTAALRAQIAAESGKSTASDLAAAKKEAAEAEKVVRLAEAEANRARIESENARSDALVAMELEKARLEALPGIVSEMVKPAEKIKSINVNHMSGFGGGSSGESGPKPVVATAMDSIMEMAVQMPVLKKIGDQMGVALTDSLDGEKDEKS